MSLPEVWDQTIAHSRLVVPIARQVGREQSLLVEQTPDENREHASKGDEPCVRAKFHSAARDSTLPFHNRDQM
jgi:hypothetical protein